MFFSCYYRFYEEKFDLFTYIKYYLNGRKCRRLWNKRQCLGGIRALWIVASGGKNSPSAMLLEV
jgi:hypothetical protein